MNQSLQDRFAPSNRCFGCGPANDKGLRIKSFAQGDELVCEWTPGDFSAVGMWYDDFSQTTDAEVRELMAG